MFRKITFLAAALTAVFLAAACHDNAGVAKGPEFDVGAVGGKCFSDDTCSGTAICNLVTKICEAGEVECDSNDDCNIGNICSAGVCIEEGSCKGQQGCPCATTEDCQEGLECNANLRCQVKTAEAPVDTNLGKIGYQCKADSTCTEGMCKNGYCVADESTTNGAAGQPCKTGNICNDGLYCSGSVCLVDHVISIPDANLKAALIAEIKKADTSFNKTEISLSDCAKITKLTANGTDSRNKIIDLKGLELFKKLKNINLDNNKVADASPLAKMTWVEELSLSNNLIANTIPFKSMIGLKSLILTKNRIAYMGYLADPALASLSVLNLSSNPLAGNYCGFIKSLIDRKVNVTVDPQQWLFYVGGCKINLD